MYKNAKIKLELCNEILKSDFFPSSPSFEERVMEQIYAEEIQAKHFMETGQEEPGGFSFRAWVIIGFVLLVSSILLFGLDLSILASGFDSSFLIPLGITIGIMLTGYGAFFIGSHLNELRTHFKLH